MGIFAVTWNVFSEITKVLLNDVSAELDGSSGIKKINTDILNLGRLQVDDSDINKIYGRKYEEIIPMK